MSEHAPETVERAELESWTARVLRTPRVEAVSRGGVDFVMELIGETGAPDPGHGGRHLRLITSEGRAFVGEATWRRVGVPQSPRVGERETTEYVLRWIEPPSIGRAT